MEEIRIKELGNIYTGKTPPTANPNNFGETYPFVTPVDLKDDKYIVGTERYVSKSGIKYTTLIPSKSICVSCIGYIGKIGITKKESCTNQQINSIVVNNNYNIDYVYYLLNYNVPYFKELAGVNVVPQLNKSDFSKVKLSATKNKPEQTAIATILSKVDEAIEATRQSIKAVEKLKKALMQNLLTGKLKPDGTWRTDDEFYEDEKFGKVPVGWEVAQLKKVFFVNLNTLPSQTNANYKFRYITIEAVDTESIDFESCPEYEFKESPGRARRIIESGDILISGVRPNLKAFAIYQKPNDENWICSTGFYVLTAKEKENNKFYFYQILSEICEQQFHSYVAGSNYPAIGDRDIKLLKLYKPPYPEQCLIEEKISSISSKNKEKQTKIKTLQRLKKSLMQNLLTGKVRLDVEAINKIISEQDNG